MTWSSFMATLTKTLEHLIYVLINKLPEFHFVLSLSDSLQSSFAFRFFFFVFNSISVSFVLQRLCVNYVQIQLKQCFSLFILLFLFGCNILLFFSQKKEYHGRVHFHNCRAVSYTHLDVYKRQV